MIEDNDIKLRPPIISDLGLLMRWENNVENWQVSDTTQEFSEELMTQFIISDHNLVKHLQLRLMIINKTNNDVVGTLDLFDYNENEGTAGIGILIGEKQNRKKGLAKKAIQLLIRKAAETWKLKIVFASMFTSNFASVRLFEGLNFELVRVQVNIDSNKKHNEEMVMQYRL